MMDTVLNLGMNDEVVEVMKNITHNERFVLDTYRRFLMMFGTVVLSKEKEAYEGTCRAPYTRATPMLYNDCVDFTKHCYTTDLQQRKLFLPLDMYDSLIPLMIATDFLVLIIVRHTVRSPCPCRRQRRRVSLRGGASSSGHGLQAAGGGAGGPLDAAADGG
jgi:hypothetical protein